ncbi:hypothetical protein J6C36_03525 [Methanocorpusculaceae archaeon]|nr:hypothetical protein [Methanocorpusculaceae archaeon]MBO5367553.1 hypothetical protein [Methanocorpusculum sp.]MBP3443693.1 hypothetical protein [Methanocorpusculaceae archaeon]
MTLKKGFTRIAVSRATEDRLKNLRRRLSSEMPDRFDENTSMHSLIIWMLDEMNRHL